MRRRAPTMAAIVARRSLPQMIGMGPTKTTPAPRVRSRVLFSTGIDSACRALQPGLPATESPRGSGPWSHPTSRSDAIAPDANQRANAAKTAVTVAKAHPPEP